MTVNEIIKKARESGVDVREKPTDPGVFQLQKRGMANLEVFEVGGKAAVVFDSGGRHPAQVSAETWTNIIFPN